MKIGEQKIIIILSIVICILVVVFGTEYYVLKNTNPLKESIDTISPTNVFDNSSGWQLYSNAIYGFQIELPSTMASSTEISNVKALFSTSLKFGNSLIISEYLRRDAPYIESTKTILVAGTTSKESVSSQLGTIVQVPINQDTLLQIEYGSDSQNDPLFTRMLNSLTFTQ